MEDLDFGVFYTCFTEKNAVEHSLDVLFKIYPEVPVYLVSDGGENFSYLEDKYKNIKTDFGVDSRSFIPKIPIENFKEDFWQNKIKESIIIFLDRVKKAIEFCDKKYILIMEPDVLVRGKISIPENAKLAGSRINTGLSSELRRVLSETEGAIEINNWGATPALFSSSHFIEAYKKLLNDKNLFNNLCLSEHRLSNYDVLLPVLFSLISEQEFFNPEIVECFRNQGWQTSGHPLVHQYRAKYPLKSEGYEGTHTNHKLGLGDHWPWPR